MGLPKENEGAHDQAESASAKGAPAPVRAPGEGQGAAVATEERRGALRALVVLGSLAYTGALAVPAVQFVTGSAPGGQAGARWVRVGRLSDLPPGEPRRWQVVGDERDAFTLTRDQMLGSVWVMREGDKVRAMSATCPHLGCSIDLNADKLSFGCPCHASRFALSGNAEAGPSPRSMDTLEARVTGEWVEVDFRRFRQGIGERKEVSA
jgi:cytochrome b6-f complex iron-sulfur subunit/menaquinol-cytochrome c reductase iron-sulfur subunit